MIELFSQATRCGIGDHPDLRGQGTLRAHGREKQREMIRTSERQKPGSERLLGDHRRSVAMTDHISMF
ncbi:hypothetical protein [Streptosporangium sp. NPDC087985]|uniref:hypothetical protein n=1 Tax=Streptosporangium sp. NPDC087985 TaxID=3366196 RepID=UPI0037FB40F8